MMNNNSNNSSGAQGDAPSNPTKTTTNVNSTSAASSAHSLAYRTTQAISRAACDEHDAGQADGANNIESTSQTSRQLEGKSSNQSVGANNNGLQLANSGKQGATASRQHRLMLVARVKTITGKLLDSHGSELRRTLFSMRQLFQDDSELATEFIESDGLECLMKVANSADLIQQNYILKAIEQLIAYSSGMNGLMRHNQTVRWLYTLLGSQHRLIVVTSIKLLLMFVDHNENNCLHLCRAIKSVEDSKGAKTWATLIGLFKNSISSCKQVSAAANSSSQAIQQQQQQQDANATLVETMSLVNKTLAKIPDKDIYYDFVLPLEELGIESIGEKCSSFSPELQAQFQIYDQLLRANDKAGATKAAAAAMEAEQHMLVANGSSGKQQVTIVGGRHSKRVWRQEQLDSTSSAANGYGDESTVAQIRQQQAGSSGSGSSNSSSRASDESERAKQQQQQQFADSNEDNYESANDETVADSKSSSSSPSLVQRERKKLLQAQPQAARNNKVINANPTTIDQPTMSSSSNSSSSSSSNRRLAPSEQQQRCIGNDGNQLAAGNQVGCSSTNASSSNASKQNDLARGKQQRASISSCSSSDSYASYGSGYASGSGNSTDHEHNKQRVLLGAAANNHAPTSPSSSSESSSRSRTNSQQHAGLKGSGNVSMGRQLVVDENQDNGDEEEGDDEDDELDEDGESLQLKQHLSELEQLTDELASRNIFGTLGGSQCQAISVADKQQQQSLASKNKLSCFSGSTIKSTSSNSSSVLSATDSNLSSLSSGVGGDTLVRPSAQNQLANEGSLSRSASATPTSTILISNPKQQEQANGKATGSNNLSGAFTRASITRHQANNGELAFQAQVTRPNHQFAMPATSISQQQPDQPPQTASNSNTNSTASTASQSSMSAPTQTGTSAAGSSAPTAAGGNQKQEPYYHNLFQWEQLVSRGVTRPLLINDLDFTDLRDEDDCDLLQPQQATNGSSNLRRTQQLGSNGEPLTINIPGAQQLLQEKLNCADGGGDDSLDSGAGTGSPKSSHSSTAAQLAPTPASAPPPMPPPPISPWFNTFSGSRPQSQLMSSPSPPYDAASLRRDQSPANSTYSSYSSSRNSVCLPHQLASATPTRDSSIQNHLLHLHQPQQHYNTLQPNITSSSLRSASSMSSLLFGNNGKYGANKRKKTMKLFWKEVREDRSLLAKLTKKKTIWDEIKPVSIDTQKLEHLFESKAKDLLLSKSRNGLDGLNQPKVKTVLDAKRSNAINIGMTKLPPMRTIKSAILKMDSSIMNREGIEKILTTMMPTEEEKSRIIEAQLANPNTPLGTAEQFLLNLASISALEARLKLWAFQLDYAQIEKEVAEPLMDLKQAIEEIEGSETFRTILGTLLAIGNFLNSTNVKGFQIDYLEKVPEVKDTVHKHSLLHHLCLFIQEKNDPQLNKDLYSEFSAVNRASKVDYTEVAKNLKKMQQDCKASWDYLKIVAKHDGLANLMNTCGSSLSSAHSNDNSSLSSSNQQQQQGKSLGKLNNLSKLSMITTGDSSTGAGGSLSADGQQVGSGGQSSAAAAASKQLKTKVSDFLTDCAERIMVLMVIHRRVMNRFQKLLVYLGCPSHQIKQTQPQQMLKIINEFALEYRTKRERVREMLLKKQQCQHHHHKHHHPNRWQINRSRWAGSQQCITDRPCSTVSSCAETSSLACGIGGGHHGNNSGCSHQGHQSAGNGARPCSPSGFSQISNYSDFMFDQASCCNSRQQSVTPVPSDQKQHLQRLAGSGNTSHRPHSMSISMFDLQNQQQQQQSNSNDDAAQQARQKDEQLRQILGADRSFDGSCNELYQMSHWTSTMARVPTRHSAYSEMMKQRAVSMDCDHSKEGAGAEDDEEQLETSSSSDRRRQSSYYKYLRNGQYINDDDESEQNSENEEILQSLVRTVTAKSSHGGSGSANSNLNGNSRNSQDRSTAGGSLSVANGGSNRSARNKILSRFNCDRKSFRRTLRNGIEVSNVG